MVSINQTRLLTLHWRMDITLIGKGKVTNRSWKSFTPESLWPKQNTLQYNYATYTNINLINDPSKYFDFKWTKKREFRQTKPDICTSRPRSFPRFPSPPPFVPLSSFLPEIIGRPILYPACFTSQRLKTSSPYNTTLGSKGGEGVGCLVR